MVKVSAILVAMRNSPEGEKNALLTDLEDERLTTGLTMVEDLLILSFRMSKMSMLRFNPQAASVFPSGCKLTVLIFLFERKALNVNASDLES
jgi:hypothetical protein